VSNLAGPTLALKRPSIAIKDNPVLAALMQAFEDKVAELDRRLKDAERRLLEGGL
jgi:hypothetical protein